MSKRIKKQSESEKELALLKLMQDINCLDDLRHWTDGINIFHVLKIARTEIRHSNMLAWLLDPNENHGLGTLFLRAFITDLSKSHSYEFAVEDSVSDSILNPKAAIALLSADLTDARVYREWNHIDVLLKLPKDYVIAIENKVDSTEGISKGESQLGVYRKVLEKNFDQTKTFKLYLTPNGDNPSPENRDWMVYTYYDIMTILKSLNTQHCNNLSIEAQVLINNYIEVLNNEIMDDIELKNLCNEIYKKHKQAFDLILEYKESVTSMASDICFTRLTELAQKNTDIHLINQKPGVYIKYTTPWSEKLQKHLNNVEVCYQFEFKPYVDDGVAASFSLVLHNPEKKYEAKNAQIINQHASKNKCIEGKDWEYKGIWGVRKTFNEIDDTSIGDWVEESFKIAQQDERKQVLPDETRFETLG